MGAHNRGYVSGFKVQGNSDSTSQRGRVPQQLRLQRASPHPGRRGAVTVWPRVGCHSSVKTLFPLGQGTTFSQVPGSIAALLCFIS